MTRFALLLVGLSLMGAASAWAQAIGPAAVVRPLGGEEPLPPTPVETLGPADDVSGVEALAPLPTDAELQAAAEAEAEAKRPAPLKPKVVPQAVQDLGSGRYLFMPQREVTGLDGPLRTNGTLNGMMFRDETETLRPVETPTMTAQPDGEPSFAEDLQTVHEELQAIHSGLADIVSRVTTVSATASPQAPVAPVIVTPTVVAPVVVTPTTPTVAKAMPTTVAVPSLTLAYHADLAEPDNAAKLTAWASRIGKGRTLNLQVITRTAAPPLGSTAEDVAAARWRLVKSVMDSQGVKVGRVSFIRLLESPQALVVKVVK